MRGVQVDGPRALLLVVEKAACRPVRTAARGSREVVRAKTRAVVFAVAALRQRTRVVVRGEGIGAAR